MAYNTYLSDTLGFSEYLILMVAINITTLVYYI